MKLKKLFSFCLGFICLVTACGCTVINYQTPSPKTQSSEEGSSGESLAYEISKTEGTIVITVTKNLYTRNVNFIEIMQALQEESKLSYQTSNGMIMEMDGVANTEKSYWMLYTDSELSNTEWGTIEYNGKTYASAMFGADSMPASQGTTYVWSYQTFSW